MSGSAPGRLISFEGGEGAGKSTAIAAAVHVLAERGLEVMQVREPGGTPIGEAIRGVLLAPEHRGLCAQTELLLMFASRAQLVHEIIAPALARGAWVVADRLTDASFAYQGGGRGLDGGWIAELERRCVGLRPDLTLLLDLPVADGLARARGRGGESDRIERESEAFFERVRAAYRAMAAAEPERWRVVDAGAPLDDVVGRVKAHVAALAERAGA